MRRHAYRVTDRRPLDPFYKKFSWMMAGPTWAPTLFSGRSGQSPSGRRMRCLPAVMEGADAGGIVPSLIETAKRNGVEPFAWLRDALTHMVEGHHAHALDELLP